jgi:small subunit ribosomal protein S6
MGLTPEGRQRQYMSSHYEITYIIRPLLEDPQVDEMAAHFAEVAKTNGGEEIGAERMGKKRLAYEIQKLREGHYVCMKFKGAAACADEIIRQMRLHENVLRALVVRV